MDRRILARRSGLRSVRRSRHGLRVTTRGPARTRAARLPMDRTAPPARHKRTTLERAQRRQRDRARTRTGAGGRPPFSAAINGRPLRGHQQRHGNHEPCDPRERAAAPRSAEAARRGRSAVGVSGSGDMYAGHDGNVYKKEEGGGWQRYDNGGWNNVQQPTTQQREAAQNAGAQARDKAAASGGASPTGQLDRDSAARTQGAQRTSDAGRARTQGSGRRQLSPERGWAASVGRCASVGRRSEAVVNGGVAVC